MDLEKLKVICSQCKEEKLITNHGVYVDMLECGHMSYKSNQSNTTQFKSGNAVEKEIAKEQVIEDEKKRIAQLPPINTEELIARAIESTNKAYEDFFTSENPIIENMIAENGKDNAILMMTAIHAHLSKVLYCVNRFRNLYVVQIEKLKKEIEDKAVKELIANHDFTYENLAPKPKRPVKTNTKTEVGMDRVKESLGKLTDKDGNPLDLTKLVGNLLMKDNKKKDEYKEGLDKIANSITNKDK